jgi:hypothetical protein
VKQRAADMYKRWYRATARRKVSAAHIALLYSAGSHKDEDGAATFGWKSSVNSLSDPQPDSNSDTDPCSTAVDRLRIDTRI